MIHIEIPFISVYIFLKVVPFLNSLHNAHDFKTVNVYLIKDQFNRPLLEIHCPQKLNDW